MVHILIPLLMGFWACLYLVDAALKSSDTLSTWYLYFLTKTGFSVGMCQIKWSTSKLNRFFFKLGQHKPNFLRIWFTLGVAFGIFAMFLAIILLTILIYNTLTPQPSREQVLTPVVPGINLPMSQIWYYLLTLLICGIVHEAGHALAAVREGVKINSFGVFIFGIYPGAFVDLLTEHLHAISPMQQLRIFCAGVWHNFIVVLAALATWKCLPLLLMPFYIFKDGVIITSIKPESAVAGPKGLWIGDVVTNINNCKVLSTTTWVHCINKSMETRNQGYCLPLSVVNQQDISLNSHKTVMGYTECCSNISSTHICFSYYHQSKGENYACLPARSTTDHPYCSTQSDCVNPGNPSVCVRPSLDNSSKLIRVGIKGRHTMLYLGHPLDLHYSVTFSDKIPKYPFVPLNLPYIVELFCQYLISLSGALALLNVVPCYALDGQWILLSLVEIILRPFIPDGEVRGIIYSVILFLGTVLIISNVVLALYVLLWRRM